MQKVLQVVLLLSLIGVFSLVLLVEFYQPQQVAISKLDQNVEKIVVIRGQVITVIQKPTVNFFDVQDETGTVIVVAFDNMDKLTNGLDMHIRGKVTRYNGELEVIANRIVIQ
jgi:RecJ-like exonuclease